MENEINQIVKQVKKGNKDAFGIIIDTYEKRIYQHCYRLLGSFHEAEEVTQEAFVKAYTKIHTFKNKQSFAPWIYRIATNTAVDWMRKKKPLYILDQPMAVGENITYLDHIENTSETPQETVEQKENQDEMQQYLLQLPSKYRVVLVLRYMDEFSLKEISETLDLPTGTIKTHLHRGREALRKLMHGQSKGGQ
ncbi:MULTISPECIES: RNA polymerase sigma factor SigW [Allobacillus]|uniref:RNA polymerase sigma factor n=1 Tax=Allobacillus salarius TaxID=1955272 RepID=A0A556PKP0_9BACI|nr:RNA polymerase sigma factor SigW [Allobacillus salarius]TSJ64936.1 RNA polymerase sigma factor SigW [Allobacillus salarius]